MIHHRPQGSDNDFIRCSHLITSSAVGTSMVLGLSLPSDDGDAGASENPTPNAFIRIDGAGKVVLSIPRPQMASGTAVRMLIADELGVAPGRVEIEYAPATERPIDKAMEQAPPTARSNANRHVLKLLGQISATARVMMVAAAARHWDVDARSCHAHEGEVIHAPTWRKLKYGELAIEAAHMPIPKHIGLNAAVSQ
jgi:isoquinoline 1-oxidoreductase beta subunit